MGAFVRNGVYYSAPAFVSSVMTGQGRQYETGTGRILRIDYIDEYRIHPRVAHRKAWASDTLVYESRNPGGWLRDDGSGNICEFTRNGLLAAEEDLNRNILQVQDVQYTLQEYGDHQKVVWNPFGQTFPYDGIPPTVSFSSPPENDHLSGTVTVSADAQDNVGVTYVSFLYDDIFLRGFSQGPFSFSWDTTGIPDGLHTLKVVAYDRNRNTTESNIRVFVGVGGPSGKSFYTVVPCRAVDTRDPDGPFGGPALAANTDRSFTIAGRCGVPSTAVAVAINVTVTQSTALGDLRLYPGGTPLPLVSSINYRPGQTRANNAIIALGVGGDLAAHCDQPSGTVHFVLDVSGDFQ